MTAPAAPTISVRVVNTTIYVRWAPVEGATDYKLYAGALPNPAGLEADIADDDMGEDGWFQWAFLTLDNPTYVRLTALNALAEESASSNEVRRTSFAASGTSYGKADPPKAPADTSDPFGAL